MNSNSNYSQFIEHSFRRLTLLIHKQNDIDISTSTSTDRPSLMNHRENNINKNELESFSSRKQSHRRSSNDNESTDSIDKMVKVEPTFRTHRTYMRPPKSQTTISYRYSPSQSTDQLETSSDQPLDTPSSIPMTNRKTYELPVHIPCERTLYDIRFERDRQNDIREKYNIPLPFQRKWLRQPRYIPQERPNIGQTQQSKDS